MHSQRRSAIALLAALAALVLAATAWADTGYDGASPGTATAPRNGGTAAAPAPAVEGSGGVAGPASEPAARRSQQPAQDEQPPQIENPPPQDEPAPDGEEETETVPGDAPSSPGDDTATAPGTGAGTGGGSGSGGLPSTGLEIGALVAMGLGLLLAGVALRRRPAT